ncbi:MAG: hypothetical protein PHY92_06760 [Alphaproteobacteria bacterium]|nr:hypothetical protein [Alphaproteobacteria bacterium]
MKNNSSQKNIRGDKTMSVFDAIRLLHEIKEIIREDKLLSDLHPTAINLLNETAKLQETEQRTLAGSLLFIAGILDNDVGFFGEGRYHFETAFEIYFLVTKVAGPGTLEAVKANKGILRHCDAMARRKPAVAIEVLGAALQNEQPDSARGKEIIEKLIPICMAAAEKHPETVSTVMNAVQEKELSDPSRQHLRQKVADALEDMGPYIDVGAAVRDFTKGVAGFKIPKPQP